MCKCRCHNIPNKGNFTIGNEYQWTYIIDGINVSDDNGSIVSFDECKFLWYFTRICINIENSISNA